MTQWNRTPPGWTAEIATSTELNQLPRGLVSRAELDATVSGIGGVQAVVDCSNLPLVTEANRRIRIEVSGTLRCSAADTSAVLTVKNGTTVLFTVPVQCARSAKDQAFGKSKTVTGFPAGTSFVNVDAEISSGDIATVTLVALEVTVTDVGPSAS